MDNMDFYTFGYSPAAIATLETRTAEKHAKFLLSELTPEMKVLDIGCGPGAITVGLAQAVAKGHVVGIDIEPSQIEIGTLKAKQLGLKNCEFRVASVFDLPFDDEYFDVVFGHTILMQFREIQPVLQEIYRVLKPGGLIGFREIDMGACLAYPDNSAQARVMGALRESVQRNGGFPDVGRYMPALYTEAGFDMISASAVYDPQAQGDLSERASKYQWLRDIWNEAEFVPKAIADGWLSPEDSAAISEDLLSEAEDQTVFYASTFCEVIGKKPLDR